MRAGARSCVPVGVECSAISVADSSSLLHAPTGVGMSPSRPDEIYGEDGALRRWLAEGAHP